MAFRIHESVIRGEIDNRVKGIVTGKIWVAGRDEPLILTLRGNAHPDLAGCLLTFTNPKDPVPDLDPDALHTVQQGTIGDLTASRKVRVFDVPLEEALAAIRRKENPPEHMANCLYLEWFSDCNGRVVIESTDYDLTISAPEWSLTPVENEQRAKEAAAGLAGFMQALTDAVDLNKHTQKDDDQDWNEHDYEKLLRESDARTKKLAELEDLYGNSEEGRKKIAQEMGWTDERMPDDGEGMSIEEMNAICQEALNEPPIEPDPHREGIDWIRTERGDIRHPLHHRSCESAFRFRQRAIEIDAELLENSKVSETVFEYMRTSIKLGGALTGLAQGTPFFEHGLTIAWLKRALEHLHRALAGLESVSSEKLLPAPLVAEARIEMFAIREEIIRLMGTLRGWDGGGQS